MVMDFGFIKTLMMQEIHDPCDHGLILWNGDTEVLGALGKARDPYIAQRLYSWLKLYRLEDVPTAENLARHWWHRLDAAISVFGSQQGWDFLPKLVAVRVWETPNSLAVYQP